MSKTAGHRIRGRRARRGAPVITAVVVGLGLWASPLWPAAAAGPLDDAVLVDDDIRFGTASSTPDELVDLNGVLYFAATDQGDRELWRSDGTAPGTFQVLDINRGDARNSSPKNLTAVGDSIYFSAFDGGDVELWTSNGQIGGTRQVKDINAGAGDSTPLELTAVGNTLFFSAFDGRFRELWKSNGSIADTEMVKDILFGGSGDPRELTNVAGKLFFTAIDGAGRELWTSDGTAAGTVRLKDINAAGNDSDLGGLTAVGDTLYFAASDGVHGTELWKSDGTPEGTVLVKDVRSSGIGSRPTELTDVGGTLFFSATTELGNELWKSDGTPAGTVMVADVAPGVASSFPSELTAVGDRLFFGAEVNGDRELWTSDGSTSGTALVKDIRPGFTNEINHLTDVDGTLYFSAIDQAHGRELWRSDGTSAGTRLAANIKPGGFSSSPASLTVSGSQLFMSADDGTTGRELWRVTPFDAPDAAPVAVDDTFSVVRGPGDVALDVLANDTDADGDPIRIESLTQPGSGSAAITGSGSAITYEPNRSICTDSGPFTYTLNGGASATVHVRVICADAAPTAADDFVTVVEDSGPTALEILANDANPDGGPLQIESATQPSNGTTAIAASGSVLTYEPAAGYCNDPGGVRGARPGPPDTFRYTLNGGATATVDVRVTCAADPVDQAPIAIDDSATVVQDAMATAIAVLANDTDPDGGSLQIVSVTQPAGGTVEVSGPGAGLTYTPDPGFCSSTGARDVFTYTLNGGSTASVEVTVTCAEAPPIPTDTSPPQTAISTVPNFLGQSLWLSPRGTIGFTSTEAGSTFECRIDGAPFTPCASPQSLTAPFGTHVFAVRAVDPAGNVDPTPATRRILVLTLSRPSARS